MSLVGWKGRRVSIHKKKSGVCVMMCRERPGVSIQVGSGKLNFLCCVHTVLCDVSILKKRCIMKRWCVHTKVSR